MLAEGVAGFLAEVPIKFGTEGEDEHHGKPHHGNHPVVPHVHRGIERSSKEVAAADDTQADGGDEARVVAVFEADGEDDKVHKHLGEEKHKGRKCHKTRTGQEQGENVDKQEEPPVAEHRSEVVVVPPTTAKGEPS